MLSNPSMPWTIEYYSESVQQNILDLPESLQAQYFRLTDTMKEHGANLGKGHTKPLREGLFELRLHGKEGIARAMYGTLIGKRIVILHCFIKKTQKTPKREIEIALARLKEVKRHDDA